MIDQQTFQPKFFQAKATVNLTVLLLLTTLFIGNLNSLPKTSSLKMMDIWLIVTLLVPFSEVILQMVLAIVEEEQDELIVPLFMGKTNTQVKTKKQKFQRIIKTMSNIGIPVIFAGFCIGYFVYAASIM